MDKLASVPLFDNRHMMKVHIVQIIVIHIVMGLSGARIFLKGGPVTRTNTMSLGISVKSMVFIIYQIATQHWARGRGWASLKANAILNGLEPVFWGAVVFMSIQGNIQRCVGTSCILSWVIVGCGIFLNLLAAYTAVVSFVDFKYFRRTGTTRGVSVDRKAPMHTEEITSTGSVEDQEMAQPRRKAERM
ncbi:hypothetical protein CLIM01_03860 [Colletotrichum limetticola]|uniref:Integral membrane protein n=1 Tax=Colletotrichum limetticola TaxID=1209924 RepID=A0ABQ9Q4T8_9PEZI|nr:hypothetical protein CLIM01_03860 [Colletotrichum limetticola]